MAVERTLSIIKPDAVEQNNIGNILAMIQGAGLKVLGTRMLQLSRAQAEGFYEVHKERPFFGELVEFMTRGPVVVTALEADDGVARYRTLMGSTNPGGVAMFPTPHNKDDPLSTCTLDWPPSTSE